MIVTICLWPEDEDFENGLTLELKRVENEKSITISFKDDSDEHIFQSFEIDLKLLKNAIAKLELQNEPTK
jgi:hypothetical protein